jgi:hypothetical protein
MPVWDEDGKAIAGLFYTYYERTDIKITNRAFGYFVLEVLDQHQYGCIAYTGPTLLRLMTKDTLYNLTE